ncbi:MAG: hypothetical protein D6B27_06315 [Gammaproteobacteria bacterium]|nr:MAG: hypothetical protein D6B27_06315 [Gammaproteobacteria bacterium]
MSKSRNKKTWILILSLAIAVTIPVIVPDYFKYIFYSSFLIDTALLGYALFILKCRKNSIGAVGIGGAYLIVGLIFIAGFLSGAITSLIYYLISSSEFALMVLEARAFLVVVSIIVLVSALRD